MYIMRSGDPISRHQLSVKAKPVSLLASGTKFATNVSPAYALVVKHVFVSLAQIGGATIRSIGLADAQFGFTIKSAVYSLERMSSLLEMQQAVLFGLHCPASNRR
ncbi:MAG: hypothetical protein ACK4TD_18355 [Ectopseudomonas guguanensis]|uniref:hypothetical protein n=1 Tax=Ectopseudomonas guguanensis TaxID=1198456 RepID=UPI003919CAFB